jgi:hypothetical protein
MLVRKEPFGLRAVNSAFGDEMTFEHKLPQNAHGLCDVLREMMIDEALVDAARNLSGYDIGKGASLQGPIGAAMPKQVGWRPERELDDGL